MEKARQTPISILRGHSPRSWHRSAIYFHALSAIICVLMMICFIVSSTHGGPFGTTQLFSGNCNRAININRVFQAVLAVLAIGISVSFDFFMRLISSPTVDNLREAHTKGHSFDIAVHSIRNVRQISRSRTVGWIMLVLLAAPIQWLFHSIAFVCFSSTDYAFLAVSEAFTIGQDFAYPGVAFYDQTAFNQTTGLQSQFDDILPCFKSASTDWERLGAEECARTYSQEPGGVQKHRNLLIVVEAGPDDDAKGWTGAEVWNRTMPPAYTLETLGHYDPDLLNSLWSFAIYCKINRHTDRTDTEMWHTSCKVSYDDNAVGWDLWSIYKEVSLPISWIHGPDSASNTSAAFQNISVKYCLSEPYQAPCKVYVSNLFILVTLSCVFLGFICSGLVTHCFWNKDTCQSLGDALQVFLRDGGGFVQVPGALNSDSNLSGGAPSVHRWTPILKWEEGRPRWGQAISTTTWVWIYVPMGISLVAAPVVLLIFGWMVW